jgi:hypothetical protein
MRSIEVDEETYGRLIVVARLMNEPIGDVVRRLVDRLSTDTESVSRPHQPPAPSASTPKEDPINVMATTPLTAEWLQIHKIYKGHRIEGTFNPSTHEVHLSTEPWANKYFSSPTAAAVAVVDYFSGDVRETPNTNGRIFWKVSKTGQNLRSIIGER